MNNQRSKPPARGGIPRKDMMPPKMPQLPGASKAPDVSTKEGIKTSASDAAKTVVDAKTKDPQKLETWTDSIKKYWNSLVTYVDGLFKNLLEWVKGKENEHPWVKSIGDFYRKSRDAIKLTINKAKDLWTSATEWQKIFFLIACVLIFGLIAYAAIQNPGDAFNKMVTAFVESLKESGRKIQSAFQQITAGGIRNGLASALNVLFEIFMAPFSASLGSLKALLDEGGSELLGGCVLCLGVGAAILYYRATGGTPETQGEQAPAPTTGGN